MEVWDRRGDGEPGEARGVGDGGGRVVEDVDCCIVDGGFGGRKGALCCVSTLYGCIAARDDIYEP